MPRSTNWTPPMSLSEGEWFDKVPKSVLFEIARQFAMRVADDYSDEAALATMAAEWAAIHANGLCPQKPAKVRTEDEILASWKNPHARERYLAEKAAAGS